MSQSLDISDLRFQTRNRLVKGIARAVKNNDKSRTQQPDTLIMTNKQLMRLIYKPEMGLSSPPDYLYQTLYNVMEVVVK